MKKYLAISLGAVVLLQQAVFGQTVLYQQNFNSYANGSSADSWYGFAGGGGSSTPNAAFVTNYLGSQVFQVTWDSTLDAGSYQYAGIGGGNGGAGTIPAPGVPLSQITFSISLASIGSTSPNTFAIYLDQYNPSQTWQEQFNPVTTTDGSFTTFTTTLDLGTGVSGTYNSTLPIAVGLDENTGFADAPGNELIIDNVSITTAAVPEPASLTLAGLGAAGLLALRRRKS